MKDRTKLSLFDDLDDFAKWKEHWGGMPEFDQKDLSPLKSVIVHFEKKEDIDAFSKLIGQKITYKTRSLWYPQAEIGRIVDKLYVDEGQENEAVSAATDEPGGKLPIPVSALDEIDEPEEFEKLEEEYFEPLNFSETDGEEVKE